MKKQKAASSIVVLMTMGLLIGCGGGTTGSSSLPPSSSSSVAEVKVSLDKKTLALTLLDSAKLVATVSGTSESAVFSSSDGMTVSVDKDGNVKGLKVGSATITAAVGTISDTCVVTVSLGEMAPVLTLNHETADLLKGGTLTLKATTTFNNQEVAPDKIEFSLDKENILGLTPNGVTCLIMGQGYGTAVVKARSTFGGKTIEKECTVTVKEDLSVEIKDGTLSEGLYTHNLITYIPDGYDGTLATTYAPTFIVTKDGSAVANPVLDVTLDETSEKNVVSYSEGTFSALGRGVSSFTVSYTGESSKVFSIGLKITVTGPSVALTGAYEFDLHQNEAVITDDNIKGSIVSAKIEGVDVKAVRQDDESIIISGYNAIHYGTGKSLDILTSQGEYTSNNVTLASMIISDKAELDLLGEVSKAAFKADDYSGAASGWGGYYILDDNIDYSGTFSPFSGRSGGASYWGDGFHATIDGRGHYIKGLTIAGTDGMFGVVSMKSTIKNLGFIDASLTSHGGFLSTLMYGNLENIYIKGKITADGNGFVGAICSEYLNPAAMKNVIMELDNGGSYGWGTVSGIGYVTSAGTIDDSYVIGADSTRFTYSEDAKGEAAVALAAKANGCKYSSRSDFLAAEVDVTSFNATIWDTASGFPLFRSLKDQIQINIPLPGLFDVDLSVDSFTVNNSIIKGTVQTVSIDDASLPFTTDGGNINIDVSSIVAYGTGKKMVITTDVGVYESNAVTLASNIISSASELNEMGAIAKASYVAEDYANTVGGSAGYFILSSDIDYNNAVFAPWSGSSEGATYWGNGWHGTFDGRGHTIKNLKTSNTSGVFGVASIYSIIKNVAFTGATLTSVGGFLTQYAYGLISNVSIDITSGGGSGFVGAFAAEFQAGAVVTNSIARFAAGSAFGWGGVAGFGITRGSGTVTDTYLIVNGANFTYQEDAALKTFVDGLNACKYPDEASFIASGKDFSSFNSAYWDTTSGAPVFKGTI